MLITERKLRALINEMLVEQVNLPTINLKDKSGYEFEFRNDGRVRVVKQPSNDKNALGRILPPDMAKKVAKNLISFGSKGSGDAMVKGVAAGTLRFSGSLDLKVSAGDIRDGEYSDPDDMNYRYRVLGGKYYILGRPGAAAGTKQPKLVTDPKEITRIQGQIRKLNQSAVPSNMLQALAGAAGAMATSVAAPAQAALLSFIAMRQQPYNFTNPTYRQKMWYVVQAARKRLGGKPGLIDYSDYHKAQSLDPEYKSKPGATWGFGIKGPAALTSANPYCQLSVTFGHCNITPRGDEFLVYDRYEFILDRDPSIIEASNDYLFSLPFVKKTIESFKAGGFKAVADFEGLLVSYENTFNYRGFPTSIMTLKPNADTLELLKAYAGQFLPGTIDNYYT